MGDIGPDEARKQVRELAQSLIEAAVQVQSPAGAAPSAPKCSPVTEQYHGVFHTFARRRMVTIDIGNSLLDDPEYEKDFDDQIRTAALDAAGSAVPDRWRTLWQTLVGMAIEWYIHMPESVAARPIPQKPSEMPIVRRAARVLAMVHELHKAGYLGVHRFYVGHVGIGVAQLLTFGGCGIWWFIDFLAVALGGVKDERGRPLRK
jgi:TM2 domain